MKLTEFFYVSFVNCALLMLREVEPAAAEKHQVALLIIDVQDCFLPPSGSLAVTNGTQVIPVINRILKNHRHQLSAVVFSQDWHCPDHVSFASQHGVQPNTVLNLTYNSKGQLCYGDKISNDYKYAVNCTGQNVTVLSQNLWPDHCIQNVTSGKTSSAFSASLNRTGSDIVVRKGDSCGIDAYSAFFDNGGFRQTQLNQILKNRGIDTVVVTGLALDFCVYYTSKDARALNYTVLTVTDAARGVNQPSTEAALKDMAKIGVKLIREEELGEILDRLTNTATQLSSSPFVYLLLITKLVFKSILLVEEN